MKIDHSAWDFNKYGSYIFTETLCDLMDMKIKESGIETAYDEDYIRNQLNWMDEYHELTQVQKDNIILYVLDIYSYDVLNEDCVSADFQRMAPGRVVSLVTKSSQRGRKDKYNRLGL